MTARITSEWLFLHDGCEKQVKKFLKHFPDGATASQADLDKAHHVGLNVAWVARNSSTPGSTLEALAKDSNNDVRSGVARNSSTPGSTLEALAKDSNNDVRREAMKNLHRRQAK